MKFSFFLGAEHNSNYDYEIAVRHNLQKFEIVEGYFSEFYT